MINLFNADCLDIMQGLINMKTKVDLAICDLPYRTISGGECRAEYGFGQSVLKNNDGKIFEHNDLDFNEWFKLTYQLLKDDADLYVMTNLLNLFDLKAIAEQNGFKLHNLLVWHKNNAVLNRWYMKNCEYTLYFYKGQARPINDIGSCTVHEFNNPMGDKIHPTEKPVDLMEFYIRNSSKEGDTVIDACMGSGTTGVACKRCNRNFIGIEIDKKYFDVAKRRIDNMQRKETPNQMELF